MDSRRSADRGAAGTGLMRGVRAAVSGEAGCGENGQGNGAVLENEAGRSVARGEGDWHGCVARDLRGRCEASNEVGLDPIAPKGSAC